MRYEIVAVKYLQHRTLRGHYNEKLVKYHFYQRVYITQVYHNIQRIEDTTVHAPDSIQLPLQFFPHHNHILHLALLRLPNTFKLHPNVHDFIRTATGTKGAENRDVHPTAEEYTVFDPAL